MNTAFPRAAMALRLTVCTLAAAMVAAAFQASTLANAQVTHTPVASTTKTVTGALASNTPRRTRAYNYAHAQLGDPYRYGATGPNYWDCSGLVQEAWRKAGISLPRTTFDMLRDPGNKLFRSYHPRRGYLVFTSSHHVGLYVGNGKMLHAPHTGDHVRIGNIYRGASGYPRYYGVYHGN